MKAATPIKATTTTTEAGTAMAKESTATAGATDEVVVAEVDTATAGRADDIVVVKVDTDISNI